MSLAQLYFGFSGRIPRKAYWLAILPISVAAMALYLVLAWYLTGSPFSSQFWLMRPENVHIWGPTIGGVTALMLWPALALTVKRLHDLDLPGWISIAWYLLALSPVALQAAGVLQNTPERPDPLYMALVLLLFPLNIWFLAKVGFTRGTDGPNRYGDDPLAGQAVRDPSDGGFWQLAFGFDGRIGRAKWWAMFGILFGLFVVWIFAYVAGVWAVGAQLPPEASNPDWLASPEGQAAMQKFQQSLAVVAIPAGIVYLALLWPALAGGVKRLHDRGWSGWLLMLYYIPMAAMVMGSVFGLDQQAAQGQPGAAGLIVGGVAGLVILGLSAWLVIELGMLRGTKGPNKYGADPIPESQ